MKQKNNKLNYEKSTRYNSNNNLLKPQNNRDHIKLKIMEKFDVSFDEAEKILLKIEMKNKNQTKNKNKNQINNEYKNTIQNKTSAKNIDSLLDDILPNYNKQISIDVNHVDLTFEIQNEKIDTLKESFIHFIKGHRSQKIKIHALKDISFQIYKGEKVGIIGYNGAGKSTLLNVISGIYPPNKGMVTTYGKISPLLSLGAGFDHNFSGRRNILLNGAVLGYSKDFIESKLDEADLQAKTDPTRYTHEEVFSSIRNQIRAR